MNVKRRSVALVRAALPRVRRPGAGNLLWLITSPPDGAKLRSVRDGSMPRRGYGAQELPHQLLHFGIRNRCCLDRRKISGVAKLAGKAPRGL
jgi:hypothetical protein